MKTLLNGDMNKDIDVDIDLNIDTNYITDYRLDYDLVEDFNFLIAKGLIESITYPEKPRSTKRLLIDTLYESL
jgi:hypothetical protein